MTAKLSAETAAAPPAARTEESSAAHGEELAETDATAEGARRVVVVMGSGRSGTSLCAKILRRLGVRMDATLHRPNEMNPDGFFEDRQIVEINRTLLEKLCPAPNLPPRSTAPSDLIVPERRALRAHLENRAFAAPSLWGFKDPRTALLLPHYRRAFQAVGIVPVYVFCARDAAATVRSLLDASSMSRELAEQVYFTRSFLALRDSGANCHILHYERLLADPEGQIGRLWAHLSGGQEPLPLNAAQLGALVDPALDRASLRAEPLRNPMAGRIAALIDTMEGSDFDRSQVVEELREIDAIHAGYQTWIDAAAASADRARNALQKAQAERKDTAGPAASSTGTEHDTEAAQTAARNEALRKTADEMTWSLSRLQAEAARLRDERDAAVTRARTRSGDATRVEQKLDRLQRERKTLKKRLKNATHETEDIRAETEKSAGRIARLTRQLEKARGRLKRAREYNAVLNAEIGRITGSLRHRAGTALVEAVHRPGWHTLALPWRLARLRNDSVASKRKK